MRKECFSALTMHDIVALRDSTSALLDLILDVTFENALSALVYTPDCGVFIAGGIVGAGHLVDQWRLPLAQQEAGFKDIVAQKVSGIVFEFQQGACISAARCRKISCGCSAPSHLYSI